MINKKNKKVNNEKSEKNKKVEKGENKRKKGRPKKSKEESESENEEDEEDEDVDWSNLSELNENKYDDDLEKFDENEKKQMEKEIKAAFEGRLEDLDLDEILEGSKMEGISLNNLTSLSSSSSDCFFFGVFTWIFLVSTFIFLSLYFFSSSSGIWYKNPSSFLTSFIFFNIKFFKSVFS